MKNCVAAAGAVILILLLALGTAQAGDVVFTSPVYLNALPEYTLTGSAGLANVACDAAIAASGSQIALLSGSMFMSSLAEGPVTAAELEAAIDSDEMLVKTQVTYSELRQLLDEHLIYGEPNFPQIGGFTLIAVRSLTDGGDFRGLVESIEFSREAGISISEIGEDPIDLVTTQRLYKQVFGLATRMEPLGISLLEAFSDYVNYADSAVITQAAHTDRIAIVADTINVSLAVSQLLLHIPSAVNIDLTTPDTIPDSIIYSLIGQDRRLNCRFPLLAIPYTLSLNGLSVREAVSVDSAVTVTRLLPAGIKTANTFSRNTVFIDLRHNTTLPPGSEIQVDLNDIYPRGMMLFLYMYGDNGDIVPLDPETVIAEDGTVALPVAAGQIYVINDRQLNRAAWVMPTADHPYGTGVVIIYLLFSLWLLILFLRKRTRQHQ